MHVRADEAETYAAATAAFTRDARKAFPDAKQRFSSGLPAGHRFFVTARLVDPDGRFEVSFVEVKRIDGTTIEGVIDNDLGTVKSYQRGQTIQVPEAEIVDWTISRPDGSEIGNRVGKFMDYYRPGKVFGAIFGIQIDAQGAVRAIQLASTVDPSAGTEPCTFAPPDEFLAASHRRIQGGAYRDSAGKEVFVVLLFDPLQPSVAEFAR